MRQNGGLGRVAFIGRSPGEKARPSTGSVNELPATPAARTPEDTRVARPARRAGFLHHSGLLEETTGAEHDARG